MYILFCVNAVYFAWKIFYHDKSLVPNLGCTYPSPDTPLFTINDQGGSGLEPPYLTRQSHSHYTVSCCDCITSASFPWPYVQDRCIGGSASSNGAVHSAIHRNEVILTPPVSRCNTPSSFRTPYCLYSLLPYCFPHQLSNMFAVTPLYKLPVMCLIVSLQLSNMFAVTSLYKLPVMRLIVSLVN